MSKLYKKYLQLKETENEKMYLFKVGIFFLFLDEDAKKISDMLDLKLTTLSGDVLKCGFPTSKITKYTKILDSCNINYEIIDMETDKALTKEDYLKSDTINNVVEEIKKVDISNTSPIQALNVLMGLKTKIEEMEKQNEGQ